MLIRVVKINEAITAKIYEKHAVLPDEVERALMENRTIYKKVGGNQYLAVGLAERYLTIFFSYYKERKVAEIVTAYPSSRKQIKSYKRMLR